MITGDHARGLQENCHVSGTEVGDGGHAWERRSGHGTRGASRPSRGQKLALSRVSCARSTRAILSRQLPTVKGLSGYVRLRHSPGASLVAYKTSADVVSKAVTLVVTVAAARSLPAADFGVMALAMTSGWILGVASDAGLPMHLATRVAQATGSAHLIVRDVMRWRWRLGLGAIAAGSLLGAALVPAGAWLAFSFIVAHQLFGAMLDTLAHAYRGLGRTDIESSLSLAHRGTIALAALTVLAVHPSLLAAFDRACPSAAHRSLRLPPHRAPLDQWAPARHQSTLDARAFMRDVAPLGTRLSCCRRCTSDATCTSSSGSTASRWSASTTPPFVSVDALRLFPAAALAVAYPTLCAATSLAPLRSSPRACLARRWS